MLRQRSIDLFSQKTVLMKQHNSTTAQKRIFDKLLFLFSAIKNFRFSRKTTLYFSISLAK